MAPLLLDRRSLIKSGFYLLLLLTTVFFGGYYSGYIRGFGYAESLLQQKELPPVALVLPEPVNVDTSVFEPQPPAAVEPGADLDVDRADATIAQVISPEPSVTEVDTPSDGVREESPGPPVQLASLGVTPGIVTDAVVTTQPPQRAGKTAVSPLASNASVTDARYSIQVGMYGSVDNAEVLLNTLNASSLDAYIDEFSNAGGESRYNVRFGFYRDRTSAKAALHAYRSKLAGDGYVVRVSD
jgi:cell division septation protein DedD